MAVENRKIIVLLLIILAIAAFFRFWNLDSIPPGLYPDEAINGNDALTSLETGNYKLFYPENNGREGLFIWLLSLSFKVLGVSIIALRVVPAIFGVLTVLGLYFLTKILLEKINRNAKLIALLSSFLLAVSFWHVNFSRIGFRAILVPFFLVFGFYFLNKAFQERKAFYSAISGIFLGLGFYTYISYRFIIFLFLLDIIVWWFFFKKEQYNKIRVCPFVKAIRIQFIKITVFCIIITFIVALPLGIYFLKNSQDFFGRASGVSVFSQKNSVYELGKSLVFHLGMFNIYGDANWRHNFSGSPQLLWPVGILFLLGFIFSIKDLIIGLKNKNNYKIIAFSFLMGWFLFFLFPGVLSYEGIPHTIRVIGVIPPVYIFSGIGGFWIIDLIRKFFKSKKQIIFFFILIIIFLLAITYAQFTKYFYLWGKAKETEGAFSKNYVEIGKYINNLPSDKNIYIVVNQSGVLVENIPMPAQTIQFIEKAEYGKTKAIYLLPNQLDKIKGENSVIIPMRKDNSLFLELYNKFPKGSFQKKDYFWVYKIK